MQVTTRGLTRTYQDGPTTIWAARDVDLDVPTGQFCCLFGASGSGKSTLLALMAGLLPPTSGRVLVGDLEVTSLDEDERVRLRREVVGVVFQDNNLINEFTAEENVALPLEAAGGRRSAVEKHTLDAMDRVGVADLRRRFPHELSGGQRQRVGIARALVGNRQVLLADEPTGALDSANTERLFHVLRSLGDDGVTIVLATHEPTARLYGDAVYTITDGRLACDDTT